MYDVTAWLTNNCNTHIAQYFMKKSQLDNKIWSNNRIWHETFSLKNHTQNVLKEQVPDPFVKN